MAQGEGGGPMTHGVATSHARPQSFLRRNVFSVDHKVIGRQYLDLALVAVVTGMVLSWVMRFHLGWPETPVPGLDKLAPTGAAGGVITPEYYLALMTMHGTIMVFFVLTTAPFAGFGNFFLPLHVGAEDMAFPRINMTSFWVTLLAFLVLILAFFVGDGPPLSGWTAYAPLSAVGKDAGPGQGLGQTLWAVSIAMFCVAQLLGSLNFIATTLDLRTKGMSLARLPFATWALFIPPVIGLDDGGDAPRPRGEGKTRERHTFGPQVERGREKIEGPEQLRDAEHRDGHGPQRLPHPLPRPRVLADGAQRRIRGPSGQGRPVADEERREQDEQRQQRNPERRHVDPRERHVFRADLNRQKEIAEARERRRGQHEEHHDRAVHRHQREVVFGSNHAPSRSRGSELPQPRHGRLGPPEMEPHDPGEHHPRHHRDERQIEILPADHLVVDAEHVASQEALRPRVTCRDAMRHWAAAFSLSHWSKSARVFTSTNARML